MEDIIFFDDDSDNKRQDFKTLRIGLFLNNNNLESWFKGQIGEVAEISSIFRTGSIIDFTNLDALVILRKNKSGGIEAPDETAKTFLKENPNGLILFVVGTLDSEGQSMLENMKQLGTTLFVAASNGPMGPEVVKEKLEELIQYWMNKKENQSKQSSTVICIKNSKGGCGATTIAVHLANFLADKEKVLVLESKNSLKHHQLQENISVVQIEQLTTAILKENLLKYSFVIVDDLPCNDIKDIKKVFVIDGTPESLENAKNSPSDAIIWNHACPDVIPLEVIEKELGKEVIMAIDEDRPSFLQSSITGERMIKDIDRLLQI